MYHPSRRLLAAVLPLVAAAGLALSPMPETPRPKPCHEPDGADARAICETLGHYMQAHATGQSAHAEAAFFPEARMIWVADGELRERPIADYIAGFTGEPAGDESHRERWIESIDVAGDAAIAKIVLDYPSARIVDYMTLLHAGGEWRIIHKSFYAERKPDA